jgi:hypothetical protein
MSKRKYSVLNYIESEDASYIKGQTNGKNIAKLYKKEPTFNFKSYLDGLCNGYALEYKSLKSPNQQSNIPSFETKPLINQLTVSTFINHEKESYNKGCADGKILVKNKDIQFINFNSYLEGVSNGYTNYEMSISSSSFSLFNFSFNNSDCAIRSTQNDNAEPTRQSTAEPEPTETEEFLESFTNSDPDEL